MFQQIDTHEKLCQVYIERHKSIRHQCQSGVPAVPVHPKPLRTDFACCGRAKRGTAFSGCYWTLDEFLPLQLAGKVQRQVVQNIGFCFSGAVAEEQSLDMNVFQSITPCRP